MAEEGLPDLLRVPTGAGKTMAVTLPWLYRRRFHPDERVRASTPRRLVLTLPMRVLVEQTHGVVASWLDRLDLRDAVGLHLLMGGEDRRQSRWRTEPERDAIVVGTLDMILSRALNRGYGESRWVWPIDFGWFNNDCHIVPVCRPPGPWDQRGREIATRMDHPVATHGTGGCAVAARGVLEMLDEPEPAGLHDVRRV